MSSLNQGSNQEPIQPLHSSSASNVQRQLLHQKLFEARTSFASPTDNLMSPCTAKLQAHKTRHHSKGKPQRLRFAELVAQNANNNKENNTNNSAPGSFGL
ncbi:hypothetical protein V1514DRAFT_333552 [Lipomyces japonicus]|uniref:uncharacterized protein n=1 Tax=Lipomyces japonicus TaxID=56871 RepID=UPI0034CD0688